MSTGTHSCDLSPPLEYFFCVSLTVFFFHCKCYLCCRQYNVNTKFTEKHLNEISVKDCWPTNGLFTPHGWPCRRLDHFDCWVHMDSQTTLWQLFCPLEVPGGHQLLFFIHFQFDHWKFVYLLLDFFLPMSFWFLKQLFQESWINTVNIVVHVGNSRTQEAKAGSEVQARLTTEWDCVSEKEDNTLTVLVLAWPLLPLLPSCLVQRIAG